MCVFVGIFTQHTRVEGIIKGNDLANSLKTFVNIFRYARMGYVPKNRIIVMLCSMTVSTILAPHVVLYSRMLENGTAANYHGAESLYVLIIQHAFHIYYFS